MDILPWIHKSKISKAGLAPLYIRVTVEGRRVEISTGKSVDPKLWDNDKKRVSGKSAQADILNKYIAFAENKLNSIETNFITSEQNFNAEMIKNAFTGADVKKYTFLQIFDLHNDDYKSKIGKKGFSESTLKKYTNLKIKIERFIKSKYQRSDLFITELDYDFIDSLWTWLITKGRDDRTKSDNPGLDDETATVIIAKIKKLARLGLRKSNIHINPFEGFKCTFTKERRVPLSLDEVKILMEKDFKSKVMVKVRDLFVTGCFTGMAFSDIIGARKHMITKDIKGDKWIDKGRTKTDELCLIPIYKPVQDIMDKYREDPVVEKLNALFPQISLQKMNLYLSEIAEICGIEKKLTTHIARHTFADFYLNNGGNLEKLAIILGHSTTLSTRNYARFDRTSLKSESSSVMKNIMDQIGISNEEVIKIAN